METCTRLHIHTQAHACSYIQICIRFVSPSLSQKSQKSVLQGQTDRSESATFNPCTERPCRFQSLCSRCVRGMFHFLGVYCQSFDLYAELKIIITLRFTQLLCFHGTLQALIPRLTLITEWYKWKYTPFADRYKQSRGHLSEFHSQRYSQNNDHLKFWFKI